MSGTLVWQVKPKSCYKGLPYDLRLKLENKFSFPAIVSYEIIPFLEGLVSCDIDGAQELIDLIRQFEEIVLNIEY